jgi:ATP-dependent helicase/nuclease subunit B
MWQNILQEMDFAPNVENVKPQPCPNLEARPKTISATEVDILRRDPYAIYAKKILNLKKMDSLEEDISNATKGNIIHKCLEEFIKKYPKNLPQNPKEELFCIGKEIFKQELTNDDYFAFWWPKFEDIVDWFIKTEKARRLDGYENLLVEDFGSINICGIKVHAKADRIDINSDGCEIIDYKTGTSFSKTKMLSLEYNQLPIEALIAFSGGFNNLKIKNNVSSIAIWSLKGKENKTEGLIIDKDFLNRTHKLLENLITYFNDPRTTYPAEPNFNKVLTYNDYEHLARLKLWRDRDNDW